MYTNMKSLVACGLCSIVTVNCNVRLPLHLTLLYMEQTQVFKHCVMINDGTTVEKKRALLKYAFSLPLWLRIYPPLNWPQRNQDVPVVDLNCFHFSSSSWVLAQCNPMLLVT